ncbi:MAG: hypothetical protein ABIJ45_10400 [Candidatus Zixiibacteriota bacterium]
MKLIYYGLVLILFLATNSFGFGIVDNSATRDTLSIPFMALDSIGNPVDLTAGDSVYIVVFYPGGAVAFKDSMAYNDANIKSYDWEDFDGGQAYAYCERVSILDGINPVAGIYSYHIYVDDNSSANLITTYEGTFQVINSTLESALDSSGLAANNGSKILDSLANIIDSLYAVLDTLQNQDNWVGNFRYSNSDSTLLLKRLVISGANGSDGSFVVENTTDGAVSIFKSMAASPVFSPAIYMESNYDYGLMGNIGEELIAGDISGSVGSVVSPVSSDIVSISGDNSAADNWESMLDGTGGSSLSLGQLAIRAADNDTALIVHGAGSGNGASFSAGNSGSGISTRGGSTSGDGFYSYGQSGSNGFGLYLVGDGAGSGVYALGGSFGNGLYVEGGTSSGHGIQAQAYNDGFGIYVLGKNDKAGLRIDGGAAAYGMHVTSGNSIYSDIYLGSSGDIGNGSQLILMTDDSVLIDISSNTDFADSIANRVLEDSLSYKGSGGSSDSTSIARWVWNTPGSSHNVEGSFGSLLDDQVSGIGSGSGIYACQIVAFDSSVDMAVPGVRIAVRNLAQTSLSGCGATDNNGTVIFNLDADSFLVNAVSSGYIFESFDSLIVDGAEFDTIFGYQFNPGAPENPNLCRVFGYLFDINGQPENYATIKASLPGGAVLNGSNIISPFSVSAVTNSNGYFYLDLIPSTDLNPATTRYEITITRTDGTILRERIIIPDQANWQLTW